LIYELRFEAEMLEHEIAELLGVTESRISQVIHGRIARAMEGAALREEIGDLYRDDPEFSKLVIQWIAV